MATQPLFETSFTDPATGLTVMMRFDYDDVSLQLLDCVYTNPSASPGTVTLSGPINQTITTPANTNKTVNLKPAGVICQRITTKFGTAVELPGGESVQFLWGALS